MDAVDVGDRRSAELHDETRHTLSFRAWFSAMQMRRPHGPARKARIHTGEVRRPQYDLMSLINELRMAHDAPALRPVESSRQMG
jgi:hypothetical protein